MTDLRFYAACLASYNNGVLHGAWIEAVADTDTMQAAVAEMLRASPHPNVTVVSPVDGLPCPSAEEWAVHDYDGAWPSGMGEHPGLAAIVSWAEVITAADDAGIPADVAKAVAEHYGEPNGGECSETLEALSDRYNGRHDDLTSYAESYADDVGLLSDASEIVARYFDFEAFGRDMELGGDVFTIRADDGLHVFSAN